MMPLLPYFLVYLSGILAALPASQSFLFPYFLSLATAITGAFSMLLTGDITETAERYVGPKDVIVSSGRFNIFRHPHPNIVDRYRRAGATLWRTDLQGAIHITTDGTDTRITHHKDL